MERRTKLRIILHLGQSLSANQCLWKTQDRTQTEYSTRTRDFFFGKESRSNSNTLHVHTQKISEESTLMPENPTPLTISNLLSPYCSLEQPRSFQWVEAMVVFV